MDVVRLKVRCQSPKAVQKWTGLIRSLIQIAELPELLERLLLRFYAGQARLHSTKRFDYYRASGLRLFEQKDDIRKEDRFVQF